MAAVEKARRINRAVNRVSQEEAAEKHDFRQQEQPHPHHSGFFLLRHRIEVMGESMYMCVTFSQGNFSSIFLDTHAARDSASEFGFPERHRRGMFIENG